jgi:hypothetical protein
MKNGAVVKPHPPLTLITDFSVNVGQSESELKQIDLNELIELDADKQTPPKSWRELLDYYNRTHLVTNPKVAENLKRGEISNDYIQLQGEQDKRIKQTALRLPPLVCGCFNPNFHSKKCGLRKWN